MQKRPSSSPEHVVTTLDPPDWKATRVQAHRMLDDMLGYIQNIRQRPVWQPIPKVTRASFCTALPDQAITLEAAHEKFMRDVLPYTVGNVHPRFMGWVHGGATVEGMLAEMLAAGLNANLGGRDQIPLEVEKQIGIWMRQMYGFPETSHGLFVTGSSQANLIGVLLARNRALGAKVRTLGVAESGKKLVGYAANTVHNCVSKAFEIAGLGSDALHMVAVNGTDQMDISALQKMIDEDRKSGFTPFLVVGSAGTVNTGSIDDLQAIAHIAQEQELWFHVDGALGALGILSPEIALLMRGIDQADSLALDFHKWAQVPYDAGFILARRQDDLHATFATPAVYLTRQSRGMAAGSPWPCDLGPDLSRGFRALKTWFTFACHGSEGLRRVVENGLDLARYLKARIEQIPELELMAPVALNVVCLRYRPDQGSCVDPDRLNADIIADLHESGVAAPSESRHAGSTVIRVALFNHRTNRDDIDLLLDAILRFGRRRSAVAGSKPELLGIARILSKGFRNESLAALADEMLQRAHADATDANALMDLSTILQAQGDQEIGLSTLALALQTSRHYELKSELKTNIRLLAIMAEGDLMSNAPLAFLLEHSDVHLSMYYLKPDEDLPPPSTLPEHDVLFVAVGLTSHTESLLARLDKALLNWNKPVLVNPARLLNTSRQNAFTHLKGLSTVSIPVTDKKSRAELASPALNLAWPVIIRPLDSHAGHGLQKIDNVAGLADYLLAQEEADFYVSPFVDYRSADGLFRKYRVVLVDGKPFAGHMAISSHWMIHYLNAGMTESSEKRSEEAIFMQSFDSGFAVRHGGALQDIHQTLGLDYLVIDCAEMPDGRLLVFELDPCAVVHSMDPIDLYPYKRPAMQKVFDAFRAMLQRAKEGR